MTNRTLDKLADRIKAVAKDRGLSLPLQVRDVVNLRDIGPRKIEALKAVGLVAAENGPFYELSTRASSRLSDYGCKSKADVLAMIETGELRDPRAYNKKWYSRDRGFGAKTYIEILTWLGLPDPRKNRPRCPCCGCVLPIKRANP